MPTRTKKSSRTARNSKAPVAVTPVRLLGKLKRQKFDETGASSRIRGHVSARGKRAQAKKDSR